MREDINTCNNFFSSPEQFLITSPLFSVLIISCHASTTTWQMHVTEVLFLGITGQTQKYGFSYNFVISMTKTPPFVHDLTPTEH